MLGCAAAPKALRDAAAAAVHEKFYDEYGNEIPQEEVDAYMRA